MLPRSQPRGVAVGAGGYARLGRAAIAKKKQRERRRRSAIRQEGLTVLQSAAIAASTQVEYQRIFNEVVQWFADQDALLEDADEIDHLLSLLMDEWYFDGDDQSKGRKALAAMAYFRPRLCRGGRLSLPLSRQAVKSPG